MVHGDLIDDGKLGTTKGSAEMVEIRGETAQRAGSGQPASAIPHGLARYPGNLCRPLHLASSPRKSAQKMG